MGMRSLSWRLMPWTPLMVPEEVDELDGGEEWSGGAAEGVAAGVADGPESEGEFFGEFLSGHGRLLVGGVDDAGGAGGGARGGGNRELRMENRERGKVRRFLGKILVVFLRGVRNVRRFWCSGF